MKAYTPSMSRSRYYYAVMQLENQGWLNPDAHMFVQEDSYQVEPDIVAVIMTQLSLKSGLKEWGDKAYLKEKRDEKIKGRTVAGGDKQWDYICMEDASLPTVATESVLLSCIIDAEEERDVAVINIPNAFVQMRVEDKKDMAIIKLRRVLVDMLVALAPDVYKSYATMDKKGVKQLVVQCRTPYMV
jgi:hypothetical protein